MRIDELIIIIALMLIFHCFKFYSLVWQHIGDLHVPLANYSELNAEAETDLLHSLAVISLVQSNSEPQATLVFLNAF